MGTADRLEACLGIDMVVAWRIYHLTMLGRETPEMPCTVFFKDIGWKALCCYVGKTPTPINKGVSFASFRPISISRLTSRLYDVLYIHHRRKR